MWIGHRALAMGGRALLDLVSNREDARDVVLPLCCLTPAAIRP
jgi:hypothetical protein